MPSLKLSNPFRRADGRPSLKERAAALRASAARVLGRKIVPPAAGPFEGVPCPPGFVPYPFDKPMSFTSVRGVIHAEACRLLDMALIEYKRRCDLIEPGLSEGEISTRRRAIRASLRLDALAAATDAGAGLPLSPAGDDAELLAVGRQFDEAHAAWMATIPAGNDAYNKIWALSDDLSSRSGWTREEAIVVAYGWPEMNEATAAEQAAFIKTEPLLRKISALPAHTVAGLAVKARAAIVAVWHDGNFAEDSTIGDEEDWTEQNVRSLVDACLSLAGVDWKGDAVAVPSTAVSAGSPDALTISLALDFWNAYAASRKAGLALEEDRITEEEWQSLVDRSMDLARQVAAANVSTIEGAAYKCLVLGASEADDLNARDDPANDNPWQKIGRQFEAMILAEPAPGQVSDKPADPVFSAIERYQTARDAGEAFSRRIELEGSEAMGGFGVVNEEDRRLARVWSDLATEVLETAPTTEAGRLALAAFIEMWVDSHGNLDGSPQDGSEFVFAEVYPALLKALRASASTRV